MPNDLLIVPDKFKGTLTAQAAARLIAEGWRVERPRDRLSLLPMSDGGDGFGEVLAGILGLEPLQAATINAAHEPCQATWWWDQTNRTAIIESARVIGLAQLPPKKHHPFDLDTFGLGGMFQAAIAAGARQCLIGIGGSATNDAGFGLARALGWRFISASDNLITRWTELESLRHIERPARALGIPEIRTAVDVQNPLLGPAGASRVYGPQKGLRNEDFAKAEACLGQLVEIVKRDLGYDRANEPGTGAAGGLGYGLRCFLEACLESGFDMFARFARLEERIRSSNLVITAEGAIDISTLMGKGVGEVARLCQKHKVPCLGLAGTLALGVSSAGTANPFSALHGIVPMLAEPAAAMAAPEVLLPKLAAKAAREWVTCQSTTSAR